MRTNYLLKNTALAVVAFFGFGSAFAQTPKVPNYVEVKDLVTGGTGLESFKFLFESTGAFGDYNNDGYLDLLHSGVNVTDNNWVAYTILYKNNGDGTFTKVETSLPNLRNSNVTWLDYDNDGNLDVFICGRIEYWENDVLKKEPSSHLYRNLGAENGFEFEEVFPGTFKYIDNDGGNKPGRYVVAADYDNDGWVDIFMSGRADDQNIYTAVYKNIQGMFFQEITSPVNGTDQFIQMRSGSLAFADYDADGYLDLAIFGWTASDDADPSVKPCTGAIYKNNGDGTFATPYLFPGGESGEVVWNDYNNDGKLDFSMSGYCYGSEGEAWPGIGWQGDLFVSNGDGTFTRNDHSVTKFTQSQNCSNEWADVNNDGFADMIYTNAHKDAIFLNNFGDKSFTKMEFTFGEGEEAYTVDTDGGAACLADYDKDGDLDAFVLGYGHFGDTHGGDRNYVMKNNMGNDIAANTAPAVPTNLAYTEADGDITFTWSASTDDYTPTPAIQYNLFVKKTDGTIYSVAPADVMTGSLKVNDHLALINGTSYTLKGFTLDNGDKYGVQAIDNAKMASQFLTKTVGGSSLPSITQDGVKLSINKNTIKVVAQTAGNVEVYAVSGMKVAQSKVNTSIELSTGVYVVKVTTANGSFVQKVAIK